MLASELSPGGGKIFYNYDFPIFQEVEPPIGPLCHDHGNMYHQYTTNVSINLPYMDPMGNVRPAKVMKGLMWLYI